jgi:hypothetical protein
LTKRLPASRLLAIILRQVIFETLGEPVRDRKSISVAYYRGGLAALRSRRGSGVQHFLTHDLIHLSAALALEIARRRAVSQHPWQVATGTVYPTTPLNGWAFHGTFRPPQNVAVFVDAEKFRCVKWPPTEHQTANHWKLAISAIE